MVYTFTKKYKIQSNEIYLLKALFNSYNVDTDQEQGIVRSWQILKKLQVANNILSSMLSYWYICTILQTRPDFLNLMIEAEKEFQEGKASKQVKADDGSEEVFDKTRGIKYYVICIFQRTRNYQISWHV